jgi:hypothetical protein
MKTALKHTAFAAAIAAGIIASQVSHAQPQRAEVVTQQRQVAAFSAIELGGPYRVIVHAQGKPGVELSGERAQLDEIETFVRGDTLVVRPVSRSGFAFSIGKRRDTVTVNISAAGLRSLSNAGSGEVDIDQLSGEQFTLTGSGPGDINAAGAVRELVVKNSGSGDLDLHQLKAANVRLTMTGPGDVQLTGVGNELNATVSGSGDLTAEGLHLARLTANMSGPGNISLTGSSRELRLDASGAGDFEGCGLAVEQVRTIQRGPGNACVAGNIRKFEAEVHGSGELSASGLQAQTAQVRLSGPGNAEIAGSVADLSAEVSGSGDLDAGRLKVGKAMVKSRGPGEIRLATVSDTLDAELRSSGELSATMAGKRLLLQMSGPADAHIDGTVAQVNAQLSGSGSLEARRLVATHADIKVSGPGSAAVNLVGDAKRSADRTSTLVVDRRGTHHGSIE